VVPWQMPHSPPRGGLCEMGTAPYSWPAQNPIDSTGLFWLLLGERLASVIVAHDNIHDGRCRHGGGIRVGVHVTDQQPKATTPQPHSYIENGLVVYTAAYHLQRGQCCGSGCRHCPFVPRHVEGNRQVG